MKNVKKRYILLNDLELKLLQNIMRTTRLNLRACPDDLRSKMINVYNELERKIKSPVDDKNENC